MKFPNSINRSQYLEKVVNYIDKSIIKVFTGQRRVGKSYLLYQIIALIQNKNPNANIIYINKEDLAFSAIKNAEDLNKYVYEKKIANTKNYVFIDEIQDILNFEIALRSLLLDHDFDIYCTGSNANLLSGDIAGFLSGRYIEIAVYSLSYTEFLDFHRLQNEPNSLEKFIKYGGLPYLIHLPLLDNVVFEYLKNIYNTVVYRDVINRYAIRNVAFLEQLALFLAANIGSLFSAKKISDFLKSQKINMPANQVQTYISYLVNAFVVHQVKRYDIVGKRVFEISDKYYFENLGIRNAIWGFRIEDRGKIIENAVYNHLLFLGYTVKVGTIGDLEVDFVAQKQGEIKYFQVALSLNEDKTIEREFGNLKRIQDNYPKYVITMDEYNGNTHEGIMAMSLRKFLSN